MNFFVIALVLSLISCTTKKDPKGPLGANAQQAATQQAADEMSNPALPATQLPPSGAPIGPAAIP